MRDAVATHISRGGNVAFFTGNTAYYRIHFADGDTAITCAKVIPPTKEPDRWARDSWPEIDPECRVTGVSTVFGGGWWDGKRDTQGYRVQHADHWIYDGTGLRDDDTFGDDETFPLIGYEVDGAAYRRVRGRAVATGELGTPSNFVILGIAELGDGWFVSRPGAAATMGLYVSPRGGIVFQGATTDWPILVPRNSQVERITRNVIEQLRLPSVRLIGPLPLKGGRMTAAADETVKVHADLAGVSRVQPKLEWTVAGATIACQSGSWIEIKLPIEADFITVSLLVRTGDEPTGFGTLTFRPMTQEEARRAAILISMREMVMTDEPSNPMVVPTRDPSELGDLLIPIRGPWIEERANRLKTDTAGGTKEGKNA